MSRLHPDAIRLSYLEFCFLSKQAIAYQNDDVILTSLMNSGADRGSTLALIFFPIY